MRRPWGVSLLPVCCLVEELLPWLWALMRSVMSLLVPGLGMLLRPSKSTGCGEESGEQPGGPDHIAANHQAISLGEVCYVTGSVSKESCHFPNKGPGIRDPRSEDQGSPDEPLQL